jgi:hypothetical protein
MLNSKIMRNEGGIFLLLMPQAAHHRPARDDGLAKRSLLNVFRSGYILPVMNS